MKISQESISKWPKAFEDQYYYNSEHDIAIACDCKIYQFIDSGDHVTIEPGNQLRPNSKLGECTWIEKNCYIGANCFVSPCKTVPEGSILMYNEAVTLTASRYDWTCPYCGKLNHKPEVYNEVDYSECNGVFSVSDNVEHNFH